MYEAINAKKKVVQQQGRHLVPITTARPPGGWVGDTALPGMVGADVGDWDYPQSKYNVHLCNAQMCSLNGSKVCWKLNNQGPFVSVPGYAEENQRLWHRWVVLFWKWVAVPEWYTPPVWARARVCGWASLYLRFCSVCWGLAEGLSHVWHYRSFSKKLSAPTELTP